jgi:hypothetical protein
MTISRSNNIVVWQIPKSTRLRKFFDKFFRVVLINTFGPNRLCRFSSMEFCQSRLFINSQPFKFLDQKATFGFLLDQ